MKDTNGRPFTPEQLEQRKAEVQRMRERESNKAVVKLALGIIAFFIFVYAITHL